MWPLVKACGDTDIVASCPVKRIGAEVNTTAPRAQ
jgi:hypothetical protein